jgi:hypothetical protein
MKAIHTAFLTTVLVLALTGTASASILATGSISFTEVILSYTGPNLQSATSVTLDLSGTVPGRINSTSGVFNCTGGIGVPAGCSPSQADVPPPTPAQYTAITTPTTFGIPPSSFLFQWGDGTDMTRYSFTVTTSSSYSGAPNTVGVLANGTFHDSMSLYSDNTATMIMNLTQAGGPGHSISLAGTIDTIAAPEPAGMVLLLGSALIGLGLVRRKHFTR